DPDHGIDYHRMVHIWMRRVLTGPRGARVVVDKSPPNLMRLDALTQALSAHGRVSVITFSRDPVAICASWSKRYTPERLLGVPATEVPDDREYHRRLGETCGQRMGFLRKASERAMMHVSYEALTSDPRAVFAKLVVAFPDLSDVDPGVKVKVKDYPAQPLRNMNAEQRGMLSHERQDAILQGLEPHREAIEALGYRLE
ncbi:MAG: sulfotransferase, partial [Pseudomonadota bacterium]